jgi:hypothetical protein
MGSRNTLAVRLVMVFFLAAAADDDNPTPPLAPGLGGGEQPDRIPAGGDGRPKTKPRPSRDTGPPGQPTSGVGWVRVWLAGC